MGEGDCNSNTECAGDLICGADNCRTKYSSPGSNWERLADCCERKKYQIVICAHTTFCLENKFDNDIRRLSKTTTGILYYKEEKGKNCPLGRVVVNENDCRIAGNRLGTFWTVNSTIDRPSGCWWYFDQDFSTTYVYFNTITDTLKTTPDPCCGGVCMQGNKS